MRSCPVCGNQYNDDANFCPRDATRLPPPATNPSPPHAHQKAIADRFVPNGPELPSPIGARLEATDLQSNSQVTLKLVGPEVLPDGAIADRTLREWKQLSKISCDRIARIVDQGRTHDGRIYIATEALRGSTLEELVHREGALSPERARAIVLQIGEALTEAQKVGVIHRDVAPSNVHVGANDEVKLLHFGLAQPVREKVFGSPAYLSPEQAEGKPVDQRSNIYSLGATYFFALTGEAPFSGDVESLLQQHLHAQPPTPSSKRPNLSPELDRIVAKALEKSGSRRHLTLRQLLSEVDASLGVASAVGSQSSEAAGARTVSDAPSAPQKTHSNSRPAEAAMTMLGVPSPFLHHSELAKGASAGASSPLPAAAASLPASAAPVQKAQPEDVGQARTMMAEAPVLKATAVSPAHKVAANGGGAASKPASSAASAGAPAKKGFRETAWFKAGEIEEELAKAQAKVATEDPLAPVGTTGQHAVYDPDKVDVSAQDKARLSLKTGATQMMMAVRPGAGPALPGERMDEREMLAEINASKKRLIVAGVIAAAVIGLILTLVLRSGVGKSETAPTGATAPAKAAK